MELYFLSIVVNKTDAADVINGRFPQALRNERVMKKTQVNFVLNLSAFYILIFMISTGLLMEYVLLPGSRGGHGLSLFGMNRHDWGDIHFYLSIAFMIAMLLHIVLHWNWIRSLFTKNFSSKTTLIFSFVLITSLLLIGAPFFLPIDRDLDAESHERFGEHGIEREGDSSFMGSQEIHIRGFMTLEDIEEQSGVSVSLILETLKLPADTPANSKIGQLTRTNSIDLDFVREIVAQLQKAKD
jgi:uncharacterized protein DUF4405